MNKIIFSLVLAAFTLASPEISFSQGKTEGEAFIFVEQMPEFPGGQEALNNFIIKNLNYPEEAKNNAIEGTVFASFIVEANGEIKNVKILRGIGYGCDEEVIRVLSIMPKWSPGKQKGKAVRVLFNLPVKFSLKN